MLQCTGEGHDSFIEYSVANMSLEWSGMTKQELEKCIDVYGRDIYSFCRYVTGSMQEGEELYQDACLKVVELLDTIDSAGNVKAFWLSVAIRIWKNKRRKYAWRKRIAEFQTAEKEAGEDCLRDQRPSAEEQMLEEEQNRMIRKAVDTLPDKLKTVVLLYYMEDFSLAEIAETAGIPEGTVKSRLHQARRILKKKLEVLA